MASNRNSSCERRRNRGRSPTMTLRVRTPGHRHERGVFGIMAIPLVLVLLAFCGLALDAGQLYNRKVDLNGMAKAVALAAARELNGTDTGIAAAKARAKEIAEGMRYQYIEQGIGFVWKDAALTFSAGPDRSGEWVSGPTGSAPVSSLYFAKVDTAALDASVGQVHTLLIGLFSDSLKTVKLTDSAVAGRTAVNVTPLAICAMLPDPAFPLPHTPPGGGSTVYELVQYGFRRGVSYDLMQLNPVGSTAARYLVNPVVAPGKSSTSFDTSIMGQFLCAGTTWVPRLTGGNILVSSLPSSFPLHSLDIPLNSRFDIYTGGPCDSSGAPPDFNIKKYTYDQTGIVKWMTPNKGAAAAARAPTSSRLGTVADVTTPPPSPGDYGPLWAFAKAVKVPDPLDAPEPAGGYTPFLITDWPTLYTSGPTTTSATYAPITPYESTNVLLGFYAGPGAANLEISTLQRRVLNIPLLTCDTSAPSGSNVPAKVKAIGKFFMTVPATEETLIAEFAGVIPEQSLSGPVELFP
jgi:hypothetical protein